MEQVGGNGNPHDSRLTLWVLFENGYDDTPEGGEPITDAEYLNTQACELLHDMLNIDPDAPHPPFVLYSGCDESRDEISFRGDTAFLVLMREEAYRMERCGPHSARFMMVEAGGPQDSRPSR